MNRSPDRRRPHPFRGVAVAAVAIPKGTYAFISLSPNLAAGGAPQFLAGLLPEVTVG